MSDSKTLNFIADRLINVYNENPNIDFLVALRRIAKRLEDLDKLNLIVIHEIYLNYKWVEMPEEFIKVASERGYQVRSRSV